MLEAFNEGAQVGWDREWQVIHTSGWFMFGRSDGSRASLHNATACSSMQSGQSSTCFYQRKLISAEHGSAAAASCLLRVPVMMDPSTKTPV